MVGTLRQRLVELLKEGEWTALELSAELSVPEKEIYIHLEHVKKSISPGKLSISPYHCRSCDYVFRKRNRLDRPGRCPKCKGSHIAVALFSIDGE